MERLTLTFEELVQEIAAINQAWKVSAKLSPTLGNSFKDLKNRLQLRLLRTYAPERVYLELDTATESEEALYSLCLRQPIGNRWNAEHLPVRVAQEMLSDEELKRLVKA